MSLKSSKQDIYWKENISERNISEILLDPISILRTLLDLVYVTAHREKQSYMT